MALETVVLAVGPEDDDRIEELAATAIDVAGPAGARVVLAHVFTREEFDDALETLDYEFGESADPDEVAAHHTTIREIGSRLSEAGVVYETRGAVGNHGDRIVDLSEDMDADLVVVGGHKRSPTGKAVFGSTAQQVMLNAACPVTFVRKD
ncbi:universal stress protein [Haloarculaceae archaeon H-GB2-1]|nr:universal stress protein [Haloarculaceae archaeon H-GB1-1]MEA5408205.1 universal stress protein [Haloarculaceae archaeon H-GB2-1]